VGLAALGLVSASAALAGGIVASKRRNRAWYRMLRKPSFTPPDRVFGFVWPVLYSLGALSAWRVARAEHSVARTAALGLWGAQLAFNAAWTPIFFGAHRPRLAMVDLVGNYVSLGAYALTARKLDDAAAAMVVPYLGWLTFAGVVNASIVAQNRGPLARLVASG
jgi:tryptophan-rich sensory protein